MKPIVIILMSTMFLMSGCGETLQSRPAEVSSLSQGQGVIIGSIVLKMRDESAMFPITEKKWYAVIRPDDSRLLSKIFPPAGRSLDLKPDGKEVPFVSVLPAGNYIIDELVTTGLSPNFEVSLRVKFIVEENKKTYIGRLNVTMPSKVGTFDPILFKHRPVVITIEDAQNETVNELSGEYGSGLAEGLQKELMVNR